MRRIVIAAIIVLLTLGIIAPAQASDQGITVMVNGTQVQSDVAPINVDGSVMLPLRSILNAIGVEDHEIEWRAKSQCVVITHQNKYVFLVIGRQEAIIDTSMIMLNAAPLIHQNRTMVPVRFVSETFGANVTWDGDTQTVYIKMK